MRTIIALARLYKGVLIFETVTGFTIYDEHGKRIPFITQGEAEAFVDAWDVASCMLSQVPIINKDADLIGLGRRLG